MTPFSIVRLAELAIAAGMPPGIFNIVQGEGRVGDALCRDPRIAKVTFTGSTRTGAAIMAACAESSIKPVTLELGGKSPQVVFADVADVDKVARRVAQAISTNAGQVCVAGSRLIVERAIADELVERIADAFAELLPGPTWESSTTLSPIISAREMKRIDGIVRATVDQGGRIVTGGRSIAKDSGGAFYQPTILADVNMDMDAVRDEIFGPVLTVQTFDDDEEAMQLAAHPSYGLAAGVHTADINRALRLARGLEAGTEWVTRYGRSWDFALPTGGYKRSGIGKDLGRHAYEANLHTKTVLIDFADERA
jgi:aldehyde dehydrogenase (NAD+)